MLRSAWKGWLEKYPKIRVNNGDLSHGRICKTSPTEQIQACPDAPCMVYFPTFTNKKTTIHVGKYTSPMEHMG